MKGEMTPRERVLLALDRKDTDRVPVDFMATDEALAALKKHLKISDTEKVYKHLGIDLRHPRTDCTGCPDKTLSDGSVVDAWGSIRSPKSYGTGVYYELSNHPLGHVTDASQLNDYPWPDPNWWSARALAENVDNLDQQGVEYAVALPEFGDPGGFFEVAWYLRGMEQFMMDMALNKDIAYEIVKRVTDVYLGRLENVMAALGDRIDIIWTSDDVAHQHGPMMSLDSWREIVFPHHQRFNRRVHELGARVMYHCCGSVLDFIPGIMEMGVDILEVLQFSAAGMEPRILKDEYGDNLLFHGGVDVQALLPRVHDPREVEGEITRLIGILGKNGGYILSPSHNVQADSPPENVVAVYRAAGSLMGSQQATPPRD